VGGTGREEGLEWGLRLGVEFEVDERFEVDAEVEEEDNGDVREALSLE
jgi:hypothetical protein